MPTTVKVSADTKKKLKKLKKTLKLKSADDVIIHLLEHPSPSDASNGSESSSSCDQEEAPKRRKKNVRDPLFSFEELVEREGMLEYYTGLDRSTVELVIKRLDEVRKSFSFFSLFRFSRSCCCFAF